ncbi:uncharacterized protein LOC129731733 [Wyeomyia smithii]|uniref:uncharacterized protein LOC129731733 n=1 Tax=Wyeomyia smithii TaxID=174621 RepID=UPI0024681F3E|nr:uncharacterized protein LOC129731733 [Wyeomyia smithii]
MKFFDLKDQSAAMPFGLRLLEIAGLCRSQTRQMRFLGLTVWALVMVVIPKVVFGYRDHIDLKIRGLSELVFQLHQISRIVIVYLQMSHLEEVVKIVEKTFTKVRAANLDFEMNALVDSANHKIDKRTKMYAIYCFMAVNVFLYSPVLQTVTFYFINQSRNETEKIEYVTSMELEFCGLNVRENLFHYAIFEFCIGIVHYYTSASFALFGIVIYCPTVYIILIFRMVSKRLEKLRRLSGVNQQKEVSNLVDLHLDGLRCVHYMESIVAVPMVLQIVAFVLILSSMVLYIRNNLDLNAISLLVLLIVVTAETYTICHLTTNLSEESFAVAKAIYNSTDWYQLPIDSQKALSLMLLRGQKREGVTAAKFCFMDIERFGKVVQTSYSIYVMLKDHL